MGGSGSLHALSYILLALLALSIGCAKRAGEEGKLHRPEHYSRWPLGDAQAKWRQQRTVKRLGVPVEKEVHVGGGVALTLVLVPPGEFIMGTREHTETERRSTGHPDRRVDLELHERPAHHVCITKPFYIGKTEVTQGQWKAVTGRNPSIPKGDVNLPVNRVSWSDTRDFLEKLAQRTGLSWRLPTEAEWEYACRAGTSTAYCIGDGEEALRQVGWYDDTGRGDSFVMKPVMSFKANAWGIHDMHGNAAESCADWFDERYYMSAPRNDPTGPEHGPMRVLRGGSWAKGPSGCRSASRSAFFPGIGSPEFGFRVVCEIQVK